MKTVEASAFSIDRLAMVERPQPAPRRGEILVRVKAASLNYRDLAILAGTYMPDLPLPYVPLSDAVRAPEHLSDEEASTLPIAALTAWSCLAAGGIKSGDTVLVQGTGGVALFALQFARAAGARVIALTSGAAKAALLSKLGAEAVINYREQPEWAPAVRAATGGRGVDIVVETTGTSLAQSLAAVSFGGFVGIVGFVGGFETPLNIRQLIGPMVRMQGIAVGSRAGLEALGRAMVLHRIRPVVDAVFPLERSADAFRHLQSGAHIGKIVISL